MRRSSRGLISALPLSFEARPDVAATAVAAKIKLGAGIPTRDCPVRSTFPTTACACMWRD